jgi:hypothetical protein
MKRIGYSNALLAFAMMCLSWGSPAPAQDKPQAPAKIQASSIQILMIKSDEVKLPIDFQLALYENVIDQVQKSNKFQHVYRDGDSAAASASDLVTLHSNVYGFKHGSEEKRQVTTVSGSTQIKVHCQVMDKAGKAVLSQDVTGKVRFIGGNLRATLDFGKKVAQLLATNFQ